MVNASIRAQRYFEALDVLDKNKAIIESDSKVQSDLQFALLKVLLETRGITRAEKLLTSLMAKFGETPDLLFKQASILGAQAKYDEACAILLRLNRDFPNRPELLKRIVTVYEQLEMCNAPQHSLKRTNARFLPTLGRSRHEKDIR